MGRTPTACGRRLTQENTGHFWGNLILKWPIHVTSGSCHFINAQVKSQDVEQIKLALFNRINSSFFYVAIGVTCNNFQGVIVCMFRKVISKPIEFRRGGLRINTKQLTGRAGPVEGEGQVGATPPGNSWPHDTDKALSMQTTIDYLQF